MKTNKNINEQLISAASSGSTKDVERYLKQSDCDPLAQDDDGYTALMLTAGQGHESCVKLLLPVSDPLAKSDEGWSVLMLAAREGHEECVRLLLPHNDPLAKSNDGRSALMWAAMWGHEDCVRILLPVSDPLVKDNYGESASQIAIDHGQHVIAGMIDAYALAQKEAALLSTEISPAPPRRKNIIRI